MTPQDIREKTFEKAMFGGYDMAAVQNYQEEVATELANAQKEVAVLKGKMKVLVDKIEEYRASEDAMRLAILSAQKVGKQIEDDAQARADKILGEAKNTSDPNTWRPPARNRQRGSQTPQRQNVLRKISGRCA